MWNQAWNLFENNLTVEKMEAHTVGPASKDVPESKIAAQPPSQTPEYNHKV